MIQKDDLVECIDASATNDELKEGLVYKVTDVSPNYYYISHKGKKLGGYLQSRFRKHIKKGLW